MRDSGPSRPDRKKARRRASGGRRGPGHLTLVPDPDDTGYGEVPAIAKRAAEGLAGPGSAVEDPGAVPRDEGSRGADRGSGSSGDEAFGSEEAARAICLRLLTSGPRTRAQLATALRKRRVPDKVAESVLSRFTEVGLIDDAAFARAWVESRHHSRGLARRALSAELRQRGIPDQEARSAVSQLSPQDELAAARRLVAKRAPATRGKPMPSRARSLMGMLARKGYPAGLAAQVVREALEQEQESGPGREDLAWISEEGSGDDWL